MEMIVLDADITPVKMRKMRRLLPKGSVPESKHVAVLHDLLVSREEEISIPLCSLQSHKYVQME